MDGFVRPQPLDFRTSITVERLQRLLIDAMNRSGYAFDMESPSIKFAAIDVIELLMETFIGPPMELDIEVLQQIQDDTDNPWKIMGYLVRNVHDKTVAQVNLDPGLKVAARRAQNLQNLLTLGYRAIAQLVNMKESLPKNTGQLIEKAPSPLHKVGGKKKPKHAV